MEGEKRRTPTPVMEASSKGANRIGVLLFYPSVELRTEAEPASETL
jgi:hypothetical protein